ncbi:MAG TPA: 50S ribosome-binding protein YggL [Gemmatimonadaceae bacterium]
MNRRQRKKHRIAEFVELGFELKFALPSDWADDQVDVFWERAITTIESLGLGVAGGTGHDWGVFVTGLRERVSVSESQREALLAWLAEQPGVSSLVASQLRDAWHDADEGIPDAS